MKLYEYIHDGGSMTDLCVRFADEAVPEDDIESLTQRAGRIVAEYEEVVFGDPGILKLEDICSICDSLQHQKDVEIKRCKDGIAIVELTRKKKENTDRVPGIKPGKVYRPVVSPLRPEKVYNMTVQ